MANTVKLILLQDVENLGLAGIPMPAIVTKALEQLQKKHNEE